MKRVHPVTVLFKLTKYFWVLAVPIIRAILAAGFDVSGAFKGSFIDITVMLFLISRAVIKYLFTYISADEKGITVKSGAVMKKTIFMPYNSMTCLKLDRDPFISLFHASKLSVYCNASKNAVIKAYCTLATASRIEAKNSAAFNEDTAADNTIYRSFLAALFHIGSRSGILLMSALLSFTGIITGKTAMAIAEEIPSYAESFAADIPALFTVLGAVLLIIKVISAVAGTVLLCGRYYPDKAVVHKKPFRRMTFIKLSGIIAVKSVFIPMRTTLSGISSGLAKSGFSADTLLTAARQVRIKKARCVASAAPSVVMPFLLFRSVIFVIICFLSGIIYGAGVLPYSKAVAFLLPVPFLLRIIYGAVECVISRITADDKLITAEYMSSSLIRACTVLKSETGKITLSQTPFAVLRNTADVRIFAVGLSKKAVVKNIKKEDAMRIFGHQQANI